MAYEAVIAQIKLLDTLYITASVSEDEYDWKAYRKARQDYFEMEGMTLIEYRVTFGWNQPHGPSPEEPKGKYTTVWAPDVATAARMMTERYGPQWSGIYHPNKWRNWSIEMDGTEELETLCFLKGVEVPPSSERTDGEAIRG